MKPVSIGKGMYRITVRSKIVRNRLSRIPEVRIDGNRVIFPEWLTGNIRLIVHPPMKKKEPKPAQTELFNN
ncbi:hypothetical protein ACFL1R_00745 [Candidatus Latescibacterota bacterium]